ncbi:MAG: hypothetical protein O7A06_16890 [Acidobacteria bacterium]|nr:hypothetical protein [Acidobacteriota bacterium]MCZ6752242.1 hypothetical protein [Acidobacteriota bacterium]
MPIRTRGSGPTIFETREDTPSVQCDQCGGNGLEPVFEHVSHPAHAPAQQQVSVEPYDFYREPRQWEENGMVHQLLEAYQICSCPAGQRRKEASGGRQ